MELNRKQISTFSHHCAGEESGHEEAPSSPSPPTPLSEELHDTVMLTIPCQRAACLPLRLSPGTSPGAFSQILLQHLPMTAWLPPHCPLKMAATAFPTGWPAPRMASLPQHEVANSIASCCPFALAKDHISLYSADLYLYLVFTWHHFPLLEELH